MVWQRVQAAGARAGTQASLATQTQRVTSKRKGSESGTRSPEQEETTRACCASCRHGKTTDVVRAARGGVAQSGRDAKEKAENALLARDKPRRSAKRRELERLPGGARPRRGEELEDVRGGGRGGAQLQQDLEAGQEIRDRDERHAEAPAIAERHGGTWLASRRTRTARTPPGASRRRATPPRGLGREAAPRINGPTTRCRARGTPSGS